MDKTLLLTNSYEPIKAVCWQKAMCLIYLQKVEVIAEYDKQIRSPTASFNMPAVVRLLYKFRRPRKPLRLSKKYIFARDRMLCQYCGMQVPIKQLTCDHVVPRSRGGKTCWENLVSACEKCNIKKADKTPNEAGMKLLSVPAEPSWISVSVDLLDTLTVPQEWKDFCYL